ncbi:unnamed protein product [Dicrocoelium dendriticum]|nr:unnamed protein product [Dicrocoelium dendriticum]
MDIPADDVPLGLDIKRVGRKERKKPRDIIHTKEGKHYRLLHGIKVSRTPATVPNDIPFPATTFQSITRTYSNFNHLLLRNLAELSFVLPTPIQAQSIPIMLQRDNIIACAPTGSGKTAAYLLPLLQHFSERFPSSIAVDTKALNDVTDTTTHLATVGSSSGKLHKIALFGLILAPTQELVRQIWSEAIRLSKGISSEHFLACLSRRHYARRGKIGAVKSKHQDGVVKRNEKHRELRLPRSTRVLIATPKRIGFLLSLDEKLCPFELQSLFWLIVDECDKMLEVDFSSRKCGVARSFRDQLDPIFSAIRRAQRSSLSQFAASVALFSATIPDQVAEWARMEIPSLPQCNDEAPSNLATELRGSLVLLRVGKRNSAVSTVKQELRYCGTEEGKLLEIRCLLARGLTYPCLIFMESRERAKEIVKEILLSDSNVLANVISSDKTEAQRSAIIRAFREGQLSVLVCTDLLGRGIDLKGVRMVINYDLPSSKEEYIHRVGRTGRAGQSGRAMTFWTDADLPYLGAILKVMRRSGSQVDGELERLVAEWELRKAEMILGKKGGAKQRRNVIISGRRGERRLLHDILKKRKCDQTKWEQNPQSGDKKCSEESAEKLKWLRRWNPRRKRISELSGAKQKKTE